MKFCRLHPNAVLPTRGSESAAGLDLYTPRDFYIFAGEVCPVPLGLTVVIPEGCYGRIAPRSGLAKKLGLVVLGGVIDSDYRGEVTVLLLMHSERQHYFKCGERIAQLIVEKIEFPEPYWGDPETTARGKKGFGSTGK